MKGQLQFFPSFIVALAILVTGQLLVLTSVFMLGVNHNLLMIAWSICIGGLIIMLPANILLAINWWRYEQALKE